MKVEFEVTKSITRVIETVKSKNDEYFIKCYARTAGDTQEVGILKETIENMDLALEWLETGKINF